MLSWTKLGSGPKLFLGPYILGLGLGQPRVLGHGGQLRAKNCF